MSDRLSIEKEINDKLIPEIDSVHFLNLDKTNSERIELFLFAMALGVQEGKRTPLKSQHGFILETSLKSVDGATSQIFSLLVDELRKTNEEDHIDDKDMAFKIAEEYANTGFKKISDIMHSEDFDAKSIEYDFIGNMDAKFEEINVQL